MDLIRPPFTDETARQTVKQAEELWNKNAIEQIVSGYAIDGFYFRYRGRVLTTRQEISEALSQKWKRELGYTIEKSLNVFSENKIAVQFMYEWRTDAPEPEYYRTYGNEFWEVNTKGQVIYHTISSNDFKIAKEELQLLIVE